MQIPVGSSGNSPEKRGQLIKHLEHALAHSRRRPLRQLQPHRVDAVPPVADAQTDHDGHDGRRAAAALPLSELRQFTGGIFHAVAPWWRMSRPRFSFY
jgi:hypothetical protein